MDIRYSAHPKDVARYTTEELRNEFLITDLYVADTVKATYSHVDRMVIMGIMPVNEVVPIDKGIDVWHNFGTNYFLERREAGVFNLGGKGFIEADGERFELGYEDCLYITKGTKEVKFGSFDKEKPAMFYLASTPAHCAYKTTFLSMEKANHRPTGSEANSNKRVINQFIHPDVLPTCQLSMGLTQLAPGSVWNSMPCHTHERRMEVYTYFELPENDIVMHFMGRPNETKNLVMKNFDAVISPSWSIHCGCGTSNYTFIWAMGGENQAFDDMDNLVPTELK
ncbi:MAG: 5-dehydro-4-deoxy-D-glucuronate isomerase [Oscillospiraceae bacterium]|nr:5-dehydro-4-deoxy-D-glucuronate isomerase [Oscillospiraceae bacterium]MBR1842865.1 5-dehydro-4-deoxy-D-glucuronate isomerase [Oscillospiraceae bacterium]